MTDTPAAPAGLERDLGWMLGVVFRAYVKSATAVTAGLPGGHRGYQVLAAAARSAPTSQSALAQQLGIDRTVMTYLLDDLESAQFVERRPAPADRRTRHVVATEQGRALLGNLDTRLAQAEAHVLAGLPGPDQQTFKTLLQRLAGYANNLDPVSDACSIVQDIKAAATP
jgi:DNA-binding MarR family transcriptional regulator